MQAGPSEAWGVQNLNYMSKKWEVRSEKKDLQTSHIVLHTLPTTYYLPNNKYPVSNIQYPVSMRPIRPIINLQARAKKTGVFSRLKTGSSVGLLKSKQTSKEKFRKRELARQIEFRQRLERAKNAGVDPEASQSLQVKTKQTEQTISLLQKRDNR